jgi:monovalent cation/hydrogen antiporter
LSVPIHRHDGTPFPGRDLVILIAGAVIITTLLTQGVSLPWLLRRLGLKPGDFHEKENEARLRAAHAALKWLDQRDSDSKGENEAARSVHVLYEAKARRLELATRTGPPADDAEPDVDEQSSYLALRLEALRVERAELLSLRRDGRINAPVLRAIERGFDLEESRLLER